ncbi:MAG: hypothetical protein ABSG68_24775 [Thermoguttaceae bacterium]|jgi:hypothetical protein
MIDTTGYLYRNVLRVPKVRQPAIGGLSPLVRALNDSNPLSTKELSEDFF